MLIRGISDSDLQLYEMGKLSLYVRKQIVNLNFRGESVNYSENTGRPAKYKATSSLCDPQGKRRGTKLSIRHFNAIDEAMEANDKLSALELTRILQERFHSSISPNC